MIARHRVHRSPSRESLACGTVVVSTSSFAHIYGAVPATLQAASTPPHILEGKYPAKLSFEPLGIISSFVKRVELVVCDCAKLPQLI